MNKLRSLIKKELIEQKKPDTITENEYTQALLNKDILLKYCVEILKIASDKRTLREIKLLIHMAEGIQFFININKQVQQDQLQDCNVIERCVQGLNYLSIEKNQKIFSAGDLGSLFYIILRGEVGIHIMLPKASDPTTFEAKEVNVLRAGQTFGELALITEGAQRTATIITKCQCDMATMEKDDYKLVVVSGNGNTQLPFCGTYLLILAGYLQNWKLKWKPLFNKRWVYLVSYHSYFELSVEVDQVKKLNSNPLLKLVQKKQLKIIGVLGPGQYFGEESFFCQKTHTLFWAKPSQESQIIKNKNSHGKNQIQEDEGQAAKRICNVLCQSQGGLLYRISSEDLRNRFWDDKTVGVFVPMITYTYNVRKDQIEKFNKDKQQNSLQLQYNDQVNSILQGPDSYKFHEDNDQDFTSDKFIPISHKLKIKINEKHDNKKITMDHIQIKSSRPILNVSPITHKNISSKTKDVLQIPAKVKEQISTRLNYALRAKSNMEGDSQACKNLETTFKDQLKMDQNAMLQFSQVFKKRNFSYSQVLNYYQQKSFNEQDKMDQASHRRQFFKFKERKHIVKMIILLKIEIFSPLKIYETSQQKLIKLFYERVQALTDYITRRLLIQQLNSQQIFKHRQLYKISQISQDLRKKHGLEVQKQLDVKQIIITQDNQSIQVSDQPDYYKLVMSPQVCCKGVHKDIQNNLNTIIQQSSNRNQFTNKQNTTKSRKQSLSNFTQQNINHNRYERQFSQSQTDKNSSMIGKSLLSTRRPLTSFESSQNQSIRLDYRSKSVLSNAVLSNERLSGEMIQIPTQEKTKIKQLKDLII